MRRSGDDSVCPTATGRLRSETVTVHLLRTEHCQSQRDCHDPCVTGEETETQKLSNLVGPQKESVAEPGSQPMVS